MAGTLTVSGLISGLNTTAGVPVGPKTTIGSAAIGEILQQTLGSGDTTIAVPTGAVAVLVVPPAANTQTLKVRTNLNSSDGGLPIGTNALAVFPIASGVTSLIVNASGATPSGTEFTFI